MHKEKMFCLCKVLFCYHMTKKDLTNTDKLCYLSTQKDTLHITKECPSVHVTIGLSYTHYIECYSSYSLLTFFFTRPVFFLTSFVFLGVSTGVSGVSSTTGLVSLLNLFLDFIKGLSFLISS